MPSPLTEACLSYFPFKSFCLLTSTEPKAILVSTYRLWRTSKVVLNTIAIFGLESLPLHEVRRRVSRASAMLNLLRPIVRMIKQGVGDIPEVPALFVLFRWFASLDEEKKLIFFKYFFQK